MAVGGCFDGLREFGPSTGRNEGTSMLGSAGAGKGKGCDCKQIDGAVLVVREPAKGCFAIEVFVRSRILALT